MSREKNGSRGTVKAVIYLLIVVILAGMVVYLTQSLRRDREPEITGTFIDSKLEAAGELTSAKMIYNGQYYDEKAALLNWERKEDAMDAIASAKEDVEQQTKEMDDLETMAQEQAKTLITGMLSETVGDKTLVVKFEE